MAPLLRIWSPDVMVFTNGTPMEADAKTQLEAHEVVVEERPIQALHHEAGVLQAIEVAGTRIERDAGFLGDDIAVAATTFAADLGVGTKDGPWGFPVPDVNDEGRSNVDGVYVLGDARTGFSGVTGAANDGYTCMASIVHEIAGERWEGRA